MEQLSDLVLFQRIRLDDRLALNTLFANYYQQLCRFACTCSVTPEQAEEIVSDVFFTLWKNRERLDIHSNVRSYLYRCVRNAALSASQKVISIEFTQEHHLPDNQTPELQLEYQQLTNQLDQIVNKLPERCRQVFVMNRFDGLKYKEISAILGISEKTIEHHMVRALDIVRSALSVRKSHQSVHNSVTVS